jgi:hypothetical protein
MANGGFLRSPRVRVLWGNINLSSYDGTLKFEKNYPLVYDVQVDLSAEGDGPTAEMKWDPTGPGFAVYEWFISQPEYMKTQITIEYFYPGGKKVVFVFVWSGQSISYGNNMSVTVKMISELAGLINANQRNTAQAYDEKTGASALTVYKKAQKQFGLEKFDKLVQFNEASLAYANKAKITSSYGSDWTFGNNIANIAKQTGDVAFATNVGQASVVIMPPFSFLEKGGTPQTVLNGATAIVPGQLPDQTKRYGYLLGPSLFSSITRTSNWKPPQQDNSKTPANQPLARDAATGRFTTQAPATAAQVAQSNTSGAAARTSSPLGTTNNRASLGIQNKDNPLGQDRQNALNDEKSSELTMDTLMCPVLVGIKPHDIIYIPSLNGSFTEDWIVQSVGYSQDDGRVNINVRATRVLGLGTAMNEKAEKIFTAFAKSQNLIGPNATLDAWDSYAWSLPGEAEQRRADTLSNGEYNPTAAAAFRASGDSFN